MKMKDLQLQSKLGFFKVIFGRTGIIFLLLFVQIFFLAHWFSYLTLGTSHILLVVMALYLLFSKDNPSIKITWFVIIAILPVFGTLLYWFIKYDIVHFVIRKRQAKIDELTRNILECKDINPDEVFKYGMSQDFKTYQNTDIRYFPFGQDMFESMVDSLKKAKDFIFLEYFIIDKGYMWDTILDILKQKAKEGVEVRVMFDGTCLISMLPHNYPKILESYGMKCMVYAPLKPFLSTYYNNRDHRKILVIDGEVAYTGGINLADEYINKKELHGYWKDTGIRLEGESVKSFTLFFLKQWNLGLKEKEDFEKYLAINHSVKNDGYVMPYTQNPFSKERTAENIYTYILNSAQEYVYITTPYFVIDNETINAMKLCAKRGVKIKMFMPHIPDKLYSYALANSNYKQMMDNNVEIYEYTPGFIHAKMFLSDDSKAVVGSVNLDYRSLYQNFEVAAYMKDHNVIKDIKKDFEMLESECQRITYKDLKKRWILINVFGNILKITAPLM